MNSHASTLRIGRMFPLASTDAKENVYDSIQSCFAGGGVAARNCGCRQGPQAFGIGFDSSVELLRHAALSPGLQVKLLSAAFFGKSKEARA